MKTDNDGNSDSFRRSGAMRRVPIMTTLMSVASAIVIGFFGGRFASTYSIEAPFSFVDYDSSLGGEDPFQCRDSDRKDTYKLSRKERGLEAPLFHYIESGSDHEEEYCLRDDLADDEENEGTNKEGKGLENILQFMMNAYGLEKKFEKYDGENGEEFAVSLLREMIEVPDGCQELFELSGYFSHNATEFGGKSRTLQVLGMFRYGVGHVSLTLWPYEGKLMADFLINPPRSTDKDCYDDEDDDEDEGKDENEALFTCIDSIKYVLYPEDEIEPNGIKGDAGNVGHISDLGPFEALSKYGKDPFRFRWWIGKSRGMTEINPNDFDFLEQIGSSDDWVNRVSSVQTPFQRIDIVDSEYDHETLSWRDYYSNPKFQEYRDYMESNPEFFRADRMLYLDGVIQSSLFGLAAYHEALVQPAMFTHPNPQRVAIVGGGECATLREILKHNTVEKVVMVEIDPVIVEVSKHYLPEWNDCSMFEGSSRYCMDDSRVEMYHVDALKWFRDRYSDQARLEGHNLYGSEDKFDVIVLDALDPQNAVDFVEALYGDGAFLNSLYNALTDSGILLTQVGETVYIGDIAESYPGNINYQRYLYEKGLKNQGFEVVMNYEEARGGFGGIWSFYASFKDDSLRVRWHMNEAQLDLEIHKRSIQMIDEDLKSNALMSPFEVFDGPTMKTYQYPSKSAQVIYCMRDPKPYGCTTDINDHHKDSVYYEPTGFDPEIPNFTSDHFYLGGRNKDSLFASVPIPETSYIMLENSVHSLRISPSMTLILGTNHSVVKRILQPVVDFVSGNSHGLTIPRRSDLYSTYHVDTGKLSFLKHGCSGEFNAETYLSSLLTEQMVDPEKVPTDGFIGRTYSNTVLNELVFNPSYLRNSAGPEIVTSAQPIPQGEEIFINFVAWYNDVGWKDHILSLRTKCS